MTEEMREIINSKNKHIVVQAYAGVGKTSTMLDYVRLHPHEKILFLVYNKEMSLDFSKRLKGISHNCDVKTIHSLAYGWFRKNFVTRQLRNINIIDIEKIVSVYLSYPQLSKIKFYLDMYLTSDLEDVKDIKVIDKEDRSLLFYVKKVWLYLVNNSDFIPHNVYLKLFQLAKVKLDYDTILQDECLDGDMFVKTDKGLRRIKHIHRDVQEGKTINVLSYNHETETFEYKKVTGSKETKNRDIYWLKTEGLNSLYCTENHRILTQRGYVRLDEIVVGKDQIILDTPTNQKTQSENFGKDIVKNITYNKKGSVYDISVEDNHNFVTCYSYVHNGVTPTGIVVHNCNDINNCMLSILTNNLDKKIIAVGDSYQMINAFNFNCDGLSILRDEYKFKQYNLTNSFRVSNKIADISSRYLSYMYKDNLKFVGLGETVIKKLDLYNATKDNQIHLLCRTRLGGLKQIADILDKDDSKKIYYVGGLDGFGLKEVERILSYKGKVYIGGKLFHINQLRQMIKEGVDDPEISRICSIYTFGEKNSDIIDLIKRTEVKDRKEADIVVLTSHSSKGLTLKNGVLGNDFPSVEQIRKEMYKPNLHEYVQRCINSECNLLYVAITRFTDYIDIGQTFNRDDKIDKSKKLTEVLDYK